jgi:SAM-dependent methyltransferase
VNWSPALERLHREATRDHFIDRLTREAAVERLRGRIGARATVVDLGCSSGHLLADLRLALPAALLIGVDLVAEGLIWAHTQVPDAALLLADICELPLADESVDGAVCLNVLEHVPDDLQALRELRRILRPGGAAVFVVPSGRRLYDYYDDFLGHERRYNRGELGRKARAAGLEVVAEEHLGSLVYPGFWAVKRWNRLRRRNLTFAESEAAVRSAIEQTRHSRLGGIASSAERRLRTRGLRLPFGIRTLGVFIRPEAQ